MDDPRDYAVDWPNFAAVSLNAIGSAHFLHNLSVTSFQDVFAATNHLLAMRYERIGFFMLGNVLDSFLGGYEMALRRAGGLALPPLIQKHLAEKPFLAWLRRTRADVVLTTSGMEVVDAIRRSGRHVPADIGVCMTDDIDHPGYLSGMRQSRSEVSRWAVDSLHSMLTHNEIGPPLKPVEIQFPSRWTDGRTLRPLPPGPRDAPATVDPSLA